MIIPVEVDINNFVEPDEAMKEKRKWNKLREKICDQLSDIGKHKGCSGSWGVSGRMYREVLKVMDAIEHGTEDELIPFNACFKTEEEIQELCRDDE